MKYIYALPDHAKEMLRIAEEEATKAINAYETERCFGRLVLIQTIIQKINNEIKEANCG